MSRRRSAARLSSPGLEVYILPGERESRVRDDNNQDDGRGNIPEMCDAMQRKRVLGYVQEGKVLKVVLSIKFIWGRDILYPRPSKID